MKNKKVYWFGAGLAALLIYFIYDTFTQPNIKDLKGTFEEVAFVRNENNKGGVVRVYAVTVADPSDADYERCADLLPVNDYGSVTKVYFFDKSKPFPTQITLDEPHFDANKYSVLKIIKRYGRKN